MKIFPAPKQIKTLSNKFFNLPKFSTWDLRAPANVSTTVMRKELRNTFKVANFTASGASVKLIMRTDKTFKEEAYRLRTSVKTQVVHIEITASGWRGFLYGVVTLCATAQKSTGGMTLPEVEIKDHPDVRYRAASRWLIGLEGNCWAYDWGDGRLKTLARIRKKIDFAMRYKINVAFFDGFEWERDKYPEFAADLRRLNRYAAERNVILEYGGHGIGIGGRRPEYNEVILCGFVKGLGERNRRSYPDGELYMCCGSHREETRYNGSCRSNEELNRLKAEDIADYVRRVEPRMLYIHHEDISVINELETDWARRCDDCRKLWPDDRVDTDKGAAGAIAHGMTRIYEGICSVKNSRSGYDGSRDCIVVFVSPGYGVYYENDASWQKIVNLWGTVSKLTPPSPNIMFCSREQFYNENHPVRRIPQFIKAVKKHGNHGVFLFAVNGADYYENGAWFAPAALLNDFYRGSDCIFNFAGTLFQEPQEVFNSECCWNIPPTDLKDAKSTLDLYFNYMKVKPAQLPTVADRFLTNFCHHYYGEKAGALIKEINCLGGLNDAYPMATLFYYFQKRKLFLLETSLAAYDREKMSAQWNSVCEVTRQASGFARQALKYPMPPFPRENVAYMAKCLEFGWRMAEICAGIFACDPNWKQLSSSIKQIRKYLKDNFSSDFTSRHQGDSSYWPEFIDRLEKVIVNHGI